MKSLLSLWATLLFVFLSGTPALSAGTLVVSPPPASNIQEQGSAFVATLQFSIAGTQLGLGSISYTVTGPVGSGIFQQGTLNISPSGGPNSIPLVFGYNSITDSMMTFTVVPSNPVNITVQPSYSFGLIVPGIRQVTATGGSVAEGNSGTTVMTFTITLDKAVAFSALTFNYTTSGGTAVPGQDYTAASGTATIAANTLSTTVSVNITGDTDVEGNETVGLTLSGFSLTVVQGTHTPGTILMDDYPPPPAPSPTLVTEVAGTDTAKAWFSLDLPAALTYPVTCRVSTRNGTALAGSDYNALAPVTITFAPGETRKWVAITVTASATGEESEQFFLDVAGVGGSSEVKSAACTIERLTFLAFSKPAANIFSVRFPTGTGQRYVVEQSTLPNTGWTPSSGVLTGTGSPITQLILSESNRGFFRVRNDQPLPPGTPAAQS